MTTLLRRRMLGDLRIRNYANGTCEQYIRQVALFARHFGNSPDRLTPEHVRQYRPDDQLLAFLEGSDYAESTTGDRQG